MKKQMDQVMDLLRAGGPEAATDWLGKAAATVPADDTLEKLRRIIDREAGSLRGWNPAKEPAFALQQIRNRAAACGFAELAAEAERRLEVAVLPWIEDLLASRAESPALIRTLPGGTGYRLPPLTADGRATINCPPGLIEIRDLQTGLLITSRPVGKGILVAGPNGTVLFESKDMKRFRLQNLATGELVANIARPEIRLFILSRDGWMCAFGSETATGFDGEYFSSFDVEVWDVREGRAIWSVKGSDNRSGGLTALAISPDNRHAAVIGCSTLYLRRLADGVTIGTLPSSSILDTDLAFTPDSRFRVMNDHNAFSIVTVETGEVRTIGIADMYVSVMALSPDGAVIAGTGSGRLRLWSFSDGRMLWEQKITDMFNQPVWFLSNAGPIAVSLTNGRLALFEKADGTCLCCFDAHSGGIDSVAASPGGRRLVTTGGGEVKIWDMAALTSDPASPGSAFEAFRVMVSPSGDRAVLQSKTGAKVARLDCTPPAILWDVPEIPSMKGATLSPDGAYLLCSSSGGTARRYPLAGGEPAVRSGLNPRLTSFTWSPCGTWFVASIDLGSSLEIMRADPGPGIVSDEEPWRIAMPNRFKDFCFSPDGTHLAVLDDRNVRILVPGERCIAASFPCWADRVAILSDGTMLTSRQHHLAAQA